MLIQTPNSDKLATLQDFRYLLLEVLDRQEPISWYDLSFTCKESTLNFAFAFENTISFLHLISLVQIQVDRSLRRVHENFNALNTDQELALLIVRKTVTYLETNKVLEQVFNKKTVVTDDFSDAVIVLANEIPNNFSFIRLLLLNLGIVTADKTENHKLLVTADYKSYFLEELIPKALGYIPSVNNSTVNTATSLATLTFFISYANKDEEFKNELQKHFSGLKRNNVIKDWDGRAILPGQDWDDEIRKKLEQAEVVLFLVSSDFLASDYIHDVEIKKTIERHKLGKVKIIPIIARPCDFDSLPIKRYQALPDGAIAISKWVNRDEAYLNIVTRIKELIKQMSGRTN